MCGGWQTPFGRRAWCAVVVALCLSTGTNAQEPAAGRLRVTVVDDTGGPVPSASVTVSDADSSPAAADPVHPGVFLMTLPAGPHTVTAAADRFAPGHADVRLRANALTKVSIVLRLVAQERVTVTGMAVQGVAGRILTAEDLKLLPDDDAQLRNLLLELAGSRGVSGDATIYVNGFSDFQRLPPKAAIELIQINPEPYSAEFPEPGTRRIEIATRPGADGTYGNFKLDYNNADLSAKNAFATGNPPVLQRTLSGYYGAPIIKNRWGFYGYVGRWDQDQNAVINATVANAAGEPVPFMATLPAPYRQDNVTINSSYALANATRLMVEYARNTTIARNQGLMAGGFSLPDQAFTVDNSSNDVHLRLLSAIGPKTMHELRIRVGRTDNATRAVSDAPETIVLDSFTNGGNQNSRLRDLADNELQIDTKLTRIAGRLTLSAGVHGDRLRRSLTDAANFGGTYTFGAGTDANGAPITPLQNYLRTLNGVPGSTPTLFSITRGNPGAALDQWEIAGFVQSDWRPRDNLTLSNGVRYQIQTHVNDRADFAPRTGLSWNLGKAGVIRAGTGLFYTPVDINLTLEPVRQDPSRLQSYVIAQPTFFLTGAPSDLAVPADQTVLRKSPGMRAAEQQMATASFERAIPWAPFNVSLFGSVGYTWARTSKLPRLRDLNAPLEADAPRPDPTFGQLMVYDSVGRARQQALQVSLQASLNKQSRIYVNYVLSSSLNDGDSAQDIPANSYNLNGEFGPAANDMRHQFFVSGSLGLPKTWIIAPSFMASSARPFNILTGLDNNHDGHLTDRPSFATAADPRAVQTRWGLLNPTPAPGETIIPRNFGRGAPQFRFDVMVMKMFTAWRTSIGPTLNVYNLFNNINLRDFNNVLTSPIFGHANTADTARRVSVGLVLNF